MKQQEEDYIEDFLKKIKKKFKQEKKQVDKESLQKNDPVLINLEERYNQQSQYVVDLKNNLNGKSLVDQLREDNMLLFQTNIDLRLFIKELQNQMQIKEVKKPKKQSKQVYQSSQSFLNIQEESDKVVRSMKIQIEEKDEQIQRLEQIKNQQKNQMEKQFKKIQELQERLPKGNIELDFKLLQENYDLLQEKNQRLQNEFKDAVESREQYQIGLNNKTKTLENKDEEIFQLQKELRKLGKEKENLQEELKSQQGQIKDLKNEGEKLKSLISDDSVVNEEQRQFLGLTPNKNAKMNITTSNMKEIQLGLENDKLRQELDKLEKENNILIKKLSQRDQYSETSEKRKYQEDEKDKKIEKLISKVQQLEYEINSRSVNDLDETRHEQQVYMLNQQIKAKNDEIISLKQKSVIIERQLIDQVQTIKNQQEEIYEWKNSVSRQEKDIKRLQEEMTNMKNQNDISNSQEVSTLRQQLGNLQNEKENIKRELEYYKQQKQNLEQQIYILENRNRRMASTSPIKITRISYDSNVQKISQFIDQNIQEKKSYINGIEQYPQQNQIVQNYDYLVTENKKLQNSIKEITQLNNQNVRTIQRLSKQLSDDNYHNLYRESNQFQIKVFWIKFCDYNEKLDIVMYDMFNSLQSL